MSVNIMKVNVDFGFNKLNLFIRDAGLDLLRALVAITCGSFSSATGAYNGDSE